MSYVFELYRKNRCANCVRSPVCGKVEQDLILCSLNSFFKGSGDWELLSAEERKRLGIEEPTGAYEASAGEGRG